MDISDGSIYKYYYDAYNLFKPCILERIQELLSIYEDFTVYFTGHSLGSAVASVTSTMLTKLGYLPKDKVKLITFGQPRVGTYLAALTHDRNVPYSFRVTHAKDLVVHYPPCGHIPNIPLCSGASVHKFPYHHGKEVFYEDLMTVGKNLFKVCNGKPFNEDSDCANGVLEGFYSIDDHKWYYNVHVSEHGKSGCGNHHPRRKREAYYEYDVETINEDNQTIDGYDPYSNNSITCRVFKITSHKDVNNFGL